MNEQARHGFNGSFHSISSGRVCNGIGSLHTQQRLDRRTSVTMHVRSNKLCFIKFPNTFRAWHTCTHIQAHTHTIQHCCLRYTERLCWTHEDPLGLFFFFFWTLYLTGQNPPMTRWHPTAQTTQAANHGSAFGLKLQLRMTLTKDFSL